MAIQSHGSGSLYCKAAKTINRTQQTMLKTFMIGFNVLQNIIPRPQNCLKAQRSLLKLLPIFGPWFQASFIWLDFAISFYAGQFFCWYYYRWRRCNCTRKLSRSSWWKERLLMGNPP